MNIIHIFSLLSSFTIYLRLCMSAAVGPKSVEQLPDPDGKLHVWFLPVGQGDASIVQCPDGALSIYDWGSSQNWRPSAGFWDAEKLKSFLGEKYEYLRNIFITHNHWDHYTFLPETFGDPQQVPNLENIYMSCQRQHLPSTLDGWLNDNPRFEELVRLFNGGDACGVEGADCGTLNICPGRPDIQAKILSVNLGQNCADGNKNLDSVVMKLIYGERSLLMAGDFEDNTSSWGEDGPQKKMVEFYGEEMQSTVYQLAHHGASYLANKPIWRDSIKPLALIATGNSWYGYGHPRCTVIDGFINFVQSLCKPKAEAGSGFYCGQNVYPEQERQEQDVYSCGISSKEAETRSGNEWALYTTTPMENTRNVVQFTTDGDRWGIRYYEDL